MARPTDKGLISKSKLTAIADQIRRLFGVTNKFTMDRCAQELGSIVLRNNDDLTLNYVEGVHVSVPSGYYQTSADYTMKDLLPPVPTITKELAAGFGMKVTARCTSTEAGYLRDGIIGNPTTTYIQANDFASGDLRITQNGTYNTIQDADKFYKTVTVNVPQPIEWDTWVLNSDLYAGMATGAFHGETISCYAPIILHDGSLVTAIQTYYNESGSTDEGYLDFYFAGSNTGTRIYEISNYSGSWTQSGYQSKEIKVPSFIKQFTSTSFSYPQRVYFDLYTLLQNIAVLKT